MGSGSPARWPWPSLWWGKSGLSWPDCRQHLPLRYLGERCSPCRTDPSLASMFLLMFSEPSSSQQCSRLEHPVWFLLTLRPQRHRRNCRGHAYTLSPWRSDSKHAADGVSGDLCPPLCSPGRQADVLPSQKGTPPLHCWWKINSGTATMENSMAVP